MRSAIAASLGFAGGLIVAVAGYFGHGQWSAKLSPQANVMTQVRLALNDPESARFDQVEFNSKTGGACGLVNAKNKMGGYVGFTRFVVKPDGAVEFEPPDEGSRSDMKEKMELIGKRIDFLNLMKSLCISEAPGL